MQKYNFYNLTKNVQLNGSDSLLRMHPSWSKM